MKSAPRTTLRALSAALALLVFASSTAAVAPAYAGFNSPGDFDRALVMKRARNWYLDSPRYSQSRWYNGYRTDCSGYVSMAWGLKRSLTTWTLPSVAWRITKSDLKAGDIMLDYTGSSKHVVIFDQWANTQHTAYWMYELAGGSGRVMHRVVPYPFWTRDRDQYKPYRFAKSPEYAGRQLAKPAPRALAAPAGTATPDATVTKAAKAGVKPAPAAAPAAARKRPERATAPKRVERPAPTRGIAARRPAAAERPAPVLPDAHPGDGRRPSPPAAPAEKGLREPVAIALVRGLVAWIAH